MTILVTGGAGFIGSNLILDWLSSVGEPVINLMWTPDVYQGAPTSVTAFMAVASKAASFGAFLGVFVEGLGGVRTDWSAIFLLLCLATLIVGNIVALVQTNIKRMLAYSNIAHAGYALIGFVALDQFGYTAALYYIIGYLLMVLACFVVICKVSPDGTNVSLDDLGGLHRRAPLLALTLIVGVFALGGIPPFVGFMGKLALLSAALEKGYLFLVIIAVINAAIAVYYYLCVVRVSM